MQNKYADMQSNNEMQYALLNIVFRSTYIYIWIQNMKISTNVQKTNKKECWKTWMKCLGMGTKLKCFTVIESTILAKILVYGMKWKNVDNIYSVNVLHQNPCASHSILIYSLHNEIFARMDHHILAVFKSSVHHIRI